MGSVEFGRELAAARNARGVSQHALARAIGVRQSAVTQWEHAISTPRNDHVFAVERVLRLRQGTLARFLGFGPPIGAPKGPPPQLGVIDAIRADTRLEGQQRDILIGLYGQLVRVSRATGRRRGGS